MGGNFEIVDFNMDSSTGPWNAKPTMKNKEVTIPTIMNATTQLWRGMSDGTIDFATSPMAIQTYKPKAEVVDRSKVFTKSRNICSVNAPMTVIMQAIINPVFKSRPPMEATDFVLTSGEFPRRNMCMLGYSFTNGFMDYAFKQWRSDNSPDGSVGLWYYADNLFLALKEYGDVEFLSLDGVKMECSHDLLDAQHYSRFILS